MHDLQNSKIQNSYKRQYQLLLNDLHVSSGSRVLDIGSGLGFLKPLVFARDGTYVGIEPDRESFESACVLYGERGYLNGFFPEVAPEEFFDVILVLSCVDEVQDKNYFLSGVRSRLEPRHGVAYVAVRNRSFFVNRFKTEKRMLLRSERSRMAAQDLSAYEWEKLFADNNLTICERGKFWRPWLTGISFIGFKNIVYKLCSMILPRTHSYMLYYKVMAN